MRAGSSSTIPYLHLQMPEPLLKKRCACAKNIHNYHSVMAFVGLQIACLKQHYETFTVGEQLQNCFESALGEYCDFFFYLNGVSW